MNILARRFPTIVGILVLAVMIAAGWWWIGNNNPKVSQEIMPKKVRITNIADNKFSVSWISEEDSKGEVEWGASGEKLSNKQADDRGEIVSKIHHVTIEGLQPKTKYVFRILSDGSRFDNNGSLYEVVTGTVIGATPVAEQVYGEIEGVGGKSEALVYLALPGALPASTLASSDGNYAISIATIRDSSGQKYINYDEKTVASLEIETGIDSSRAVVQLAASQPVPKMALGQEYEFLAATTDKPIVAEVGQAQEEAVATIFNVEPLGDTTNSVTKVVLLNPAEEGEVLATTLPEFRGTGPASGVLSITVYSDAPYAGSVEIGTDGNWKWSPPSQLQEGEGSITISYLDDNQTEQIIERGFVISSSAAVDGNPAFEATPSSQITSSPSPSPSPSLAASPTPREVIPSTESGVPVTGVFELTLLTGVVGIVIMVVGVALMAL